MTPCETCQAQLLDHLYGLLDEPEQTALVGHLESCENCRAALATVEAQRQTLSAAARAHFPGVRFEPPTASVTQQMPQAGRSKTRPVRAWGRWAAAASVLFALGGLGVAGFLSWFWYHGDHQQAQARYQQLVSQRKLLQGKHQADNERTAHDIRAIQEQIKLLEAKWDGELAQVRKDLAEKQLQVIVTGPRDVQAGGRNEYQIETRRLVRQGNQLADGAPTPTEVQARVVDPASGKVVHEQKIKNAGRCQLLLPRDLPLKPGTQLALEVTARDAGGIQAQLTEQLPLVGSVYMTHLTTDRPLYRPGEVVHFRSLTLDRVSLKPAAEDFRLQYTITNGQGQQVFTASGSAELKEAGAKAPLKGPDGRTVRGVGAGEFRIPDGASGGEYTLTVADGQNRFPQERRKFIVQQYQAPRLNKELEFTRKSYGPGEQVEAIGKVAPVQGGKPLAGQPVFATVNVDGKVENLEPLTVDAVGQVRVRFKLPAGIERGAGSLSLQFTDGGNVETIVRPIPIVLKKLTVDFYPEGGDLVAGVPNRVYFQVRTTLGKPAELSGRIVDQDGKEAAHVQTLNDDHEPGVNQGMGLFALTPRAGKTYELKIDAPIGMEGRYVLPAVKADGVALSVPVGVITDKIDVLVHTGKAERRLLVGAYCRGRLLDHVRVEARPGEPAQAALKTAEGVSGVHRVTVFEERTTGGKVQLVPVAERLVYRRPVEKLALTVRPDQTTYSPGQRVKLSLGAADEKQQPVPVFALVSVVDQSVLKLADDKTARSMPTHFLLTTEVQRPEELEYADFLVSDHPKASAALDLLLGTQGWRRFAEQNPDSFFQQRPAEADRLLMASGRSQAQRTDFLKLEMAKVDRKYAATYKDQQETLAVAEGVEDRTREEDALEQRHHEARVQLASSAVTTTGLALEQHNQWLLQAAGVVGATLLLAFGFGALVLGMLRASQGRRGATPRILVGLCSLSLLFLGGAAVTFYYLGRFHERDYGTFTTVSANAGAAAAPMAEKATEKGMEMGADAAPVQNMAPPVPKMADDAVGQHFEPAKAPPAALEQLLAERGAQKKIEVLGEQFANKGQGAREDKQVVGPALVPMAEQQHQMAVAGEPMPPGLADMELGRNMDRFGQPGRPQFGFLEAQERLLRKQGDFNGLMRRRMVDGAAQAPPAVEPFVVRVYAHARKNSPDNVRRDFTETLYWHPVLVLADGKADVAFDLSDAVTRFEVQVWAHGLDGRLGATTAELISRLPYTVEPKVPIEVTRTDQITIPVALANDTQQACSVKLKGSAVNLELQGDAERALVLKAESRGRQLYRLLPTCIEGEATVRFQGVFQGGPSDTVERTFKVVPEGFPIVGAHSDLLEKSASHDVVLPEGWVKGTLQVKAQVFPSTLADLQKGLEALLQEPCGCFEQSSTSNYPNVLILNYLKESDQSRPEVEQRARQLLNSGYSKLVAFECIDPRDQGKRRGYEWFGQTAPPHEALTAYGLLQFRDMAKVHPVDQAMLERTQKYLLAQRDGKGGFKRNPQALDTFGQAPPHITDAYIVWALSESGVEADLGPELNALNEKAKTSKDPYFLALVGNSLIVRGRVPDGMTVLKTLAAMQKKDGQLTGAQTSITCSGGRDLEIETTALATLAWLKANRPGDFNLNVQKAAGWLGKQRGGYGGFGSTQSTILALKALIAFTRENRKTAEAGELRLYVGDAEQAVARKEFAAGTQEPVVGGGGPPPPPHNGEGRAAQARQESAAGGHHRQEQLPLHVDVVVPDAEAGQRREVPGVPGDEA